MAEKFTELGLDERIIQGISELNFEKPTGVQERVIPKLLSENNDLVCLAQTGTGKTAAFGLPLIDRVCKAIAERAQSAPAEKGNGKKWYDFYEKEVQALILCPTRELCRQIATDLQNYACYIKEIKIVSVYGGAGMALQIKMLRNSPQIIVATPGRILDLLNKGATDVSHIHTLVLDEADEMLDMGFKDELDSILKLTPSEKRVLLFSATLPKEVEEIAKSYMKNAEVTTVGERNSGAQNVEHFFYVANEKERYSTLKRVVDFFPDIYGIIFCRTRKETQDIANDLIKSGYNADALHGDLSQIQRDYVMARFKNKSLRILVATDVAARGIDVNNLTHVINYNLPDEVEQYTHRSGRTGRADKSGISLSIINSREQSKIKKIEKIIGKEFTRLKVPTANEIFDQQITALAEKMKSVDIDERIKGLMPAISKQLEEVSKEEIIAKFFSTELYQLLKHYEGVNDEGAKKGKKEKERVKKVSQNEQTDNGFTWIRMNIGERDDVSMRKVLRMMTTLGIGKRGIGKIVLKSDHLYVSIADKAAQYVVDQTNNSDYKGKRLKSCIVNDIQIE